MKKHVTTNATAPASIQTYYTGAVTFYQQGEWNVNHSRKLTMQKQSRYLTKWGSQFRGDNRINHVMNCPNNSTTCALSCCPSVDPTYAHQTNQQWTCKAQL